MSPWVSWLEWTFCESQILKLDTYMRLIEPSLFGYDQGVMGGLLTLASFVGTFPEIDTTTATETAQHLNASQQTHRSTIQGT